MRFTRMMLWKGLALFLCLCSVSMAAEEPPLYLVLSNGSIINVSQKGLDVTLPNRPPDSVVQQGGMRFNVFYQDANGNGFRAPNNVGLLRQTRYEEALSYVAQVLGATGTLDVLVAASASVNNGTLALGGTFFLGINGYQNGTAFQRITAGPNKPSAINPEVFLQVNFAPNTQFHVGAGVPPNNQFDLQSVLLHEILHAMCFISLTEADGSSPFESNNNPRFTYTVYDSLIRVNTGNRFLFPLGGTRFRSLMAVPRTCAGVTSDSQGHSRPRSLGACRRCSPRLHSARAAALAIWKPATFRAAR